MCASSGPALVGRAMPEARRVVTTAELTVLLNGVRVSPRFPTPLQRELAR